MNPSCIRIALLHLTPRLGDLKHNLHQTATAMRCAAAAGAEWIVTSELCLCGYRFDRQIGTDWIAPWPDAHGMELARLAGEWGITLFVSHPERDPATNRLHNTVFAIGPDGTTLGSQRKTHVIPVSEAWASRADIVAPVVAPPFRVGMLVCADAYTPALAGRLREQGAQILLSPAAWGPRLHGPKGEWEARSRETGLPILVCNRAGTDEEPDFIGAESVGIAGGRRVLEYGETDPAVVRAEWEPESGTIRPLETIRL